jgi:transcriptional regulator with XRE-family HTH domain
MMNIKKTQVERNFSGLNRQLSHLMKIKGITIQALSKDAGVAVGTIQKLLTDPSCNPTISSIEAICNVLDVSISELIGQEERMNALNGSSVLLLDWDELPITLSNIHHLTESKNEEREMIKTSCPVSKNAFALKMRDNSMLPLFPENAVLIFDPDKAEQDNAYVLVQMHNYQNVMFKQLLIDEPFKYVTSINPLFKETVIKLDQQDHVIAVLVQSQMRF